MSLVVDDYDKSLATVSTYSRLLGHRTHIQPIENHMNGSGPKTVRVPRQLIVDKSILSSDIRLLAALIGLSNSLGEVTAGLDIIAEHAGLTKRTVCSALSRLESRGLLQREHHRGPYTKPIRLSSGAVA